MDALSYLIVPFYSAYGKDFQTFIFTKQMQIYGCKFTKAWEIINMHAHTKWFQF